MSDLILHHYETSPFSEKMRLIFGAKGLAWQSVIVPAMLPKPDVMALTGGYRRTPFLQIGADIYCDTTLMCRVVEARAPQVPLYPASQAGLAEIIAQWADTALFWVAVPYTIQPISVPHMFAGATPEFMAAFARDRAAMTPNMQRASLPDAAAQIRAYLGRLENMLADKRDFLLGATPTIADFSTVHIIWFMRRSPPIATILEPYPMLLAWFARVAAFGHGSPSKLSSAEALGIAAAAPGHAATRIDTGAGFTEGETVRVTPTDYAHDPVQGTLVGLTDTSVVIARTDPRAGTVHVHFPRIGFQVARPT